MKKIIMFSFILVVMLGICNVIYARYILHKSFNIEITSAPFYFDATTTEKQFQIYENSVEINLIIKNYNEENYNKFDTNYKIELLNKEKFIFSADNQEVVSQMINGNSIIDKNVKLVLVPKVNVTLDTIENVELKITSTYPYKKEITIQTQIITDENPRYFKRRRNKRRTILN